MTKQELLKWLQGLAVALAAAIAQYLAPGHTLTQILVVVVLTRVAGYGVAKIPVSS